MKNALVVGLGKSGMSTARLLAEHSRQVFITEVKKEDESRVFLGPLIRDNIVKKENIEFGGHTERFTENIDLVVVSPGVKNTALPIKIAQEKNIPVVSELELAFSYCPAPIIAITGTSGKTTVTTLIGRMLKKAGRRACICGNIGNPLSGEIKGLDKDSIVVLEVSSFQLEWINNFRPKVSAILNISTNHLDRHKDMDEYISLKMKIFSNQRDGDILFLNSKDRILKDIREKVSGPKVEFFNDHLDFRNKLSIDNEDFQAAMSIASYEGVNEEDMLAVIKEFNGIEHRLEKVRVVDGVQFINDSKATTISSVEWALKSLEGKIVLILGGRYKGGDFSRLEPYLEKKVSSIVAIGEAKERIKSDLKNFSNIIEGRTFEEAFNKAVKESRKGDKVLLSPGCSSFDMFKDYEERGRSFKELCRRLKESR
ncbi:MAG: UDP-N-acetylmuramoyl-L-alanine--D-glutamate ligase [Candidatus Omnitrophota bacterium]